MWLFALFIAWPLIEIGLFVTLGGWIGLWPTLALVLGTGMLGVSILRGSGLRTVAEVRSSVAGVQMHQPIARSVLTMLAALLLILPGFLTDGLGLILLVPPVQGFLAQRLLARVQQSRAGLFHTIQTRDGSAADRSGRGQVIDGEFEEIEPPKQPTHPTSGWTRH